MICQVLAVPPPAVRPSVKHDAQQEAKTISVTLLSTLSSQITLFRKKFKQMLAATSLMIGAQFCSITLLP